MLEIGNYNVMDITGYEREFYVLELDGRRALLPRTGTKTRMMPGGSVRVFVYLNAPGDLRATMQKPLAVKDQTACLRVKETLGFGAFLDWGIEKDLFVPTRCQPRPLRQGQLVITRVCVEPGGEGLIGDCRYRDYLSKTAPDFKPGETVDLLICNRTPLGYNVLINNACEGLVYHNEIFSKLGFGEQRIGYIKGVREDGGIDVSLQRPGPGAIDDSADLIYKALEEAGGFLPLGDSSSPDLIRDTLGLSKKAFKRGMGSLYKKRLIKITDDGISLK